MDFNLYEMVHTFETNAPKDYNNIRVWKFTNCPKGVKEQLEAIRDSPFDADYSIVAFDITDDKIYGIIFARQENIKNPQNIFESEEIKDFLESVDGLHLFKIVYADCLDRSILLWMLNECHLSYCNRDLQRDDLYIWTIHDGEYIFSKTKQEDKFFPNELNEVSRKFMRLFVSEAI